MNIQSVGVAAYTSQLGTEQTQQPNGQAPVDQSPPDRGEHVDQTLDPGRGEGARTEQSGPDEAPLAGYTADAQWSSIRGAAGTISILA